MDWCGSSTPKTPEYQLIKKKHKEKVVSASANDCEALILENTSIYDVFSRIRTVRLML